MESGNDTEEVTLVRAKQQKGLIMLSLTGFQTFPASVQALQYLSQQTVLN